MRLSNLISSSKHDLSPFQDPFELFRSEIDSLISRSFKSSLINLDLDVCDKGEEVVIKADVPGLEEKDISINLTNDLLTIQGERTREKKKEEDNYYLMERNYGSFSRSIRLPFQINQEDIEAKLDKGILTITVKKPREAQNQPKKIEIKSS